jgi:hypothetical protein
MKANKNFSCTEIIGDEGNVGTDSAPKLLVMKANTERICTEIIGDEGNNAVKNSPKLLVMKAQWEQETHRNYW